MNETIYARWLISKDQARIISLVYLLVVSGFFVFSFFSIYIVARSTNIIVLVIPILLGLLLFAILPEVFRTWKAYQENSEVYLTEKGVYKKPITNPNDYLFLPWEKISAYDVKYFSSTSPFKKLFPTPTLFTLKTFENSKHQFEAIGEDVDIFRAYLKEHNISFGFIQS